VEGFHVVLHHLIAFCLAERIAGGPVSRAMKRAVFLDRDGCSIHGGAWWSLGAPLELETFEIYRGGRQRGRLRAMACWRSWSPTSPSWRR